VRRRRRIRRANRADIKRDRGQLRIWKSSAIFGNVIQSLCAIGYCLKVRLAAHKNANTQNWQTAAGAQFRE